MSNMHQNGLKVEKLRGRDNYDTWKVSAKSYLIIKDLWTVIEKDISSDDSPETNARVISEITLLIEPPLYSYIPDTNTALEVWKSIEKAFDDPGVTRKVKLFSISLYSFDYEQRRIWKCI